MHPPGEQPKIAAEAAASYEVLAGRADSGLVILCDHAGNALPAEYGTLGLPEPQLTRHIAYDIGAAEVTRLLNRALGAPAVLTHYSRLLIDPNRGADDPTLIMRLSDGAIVPGNRHIDAAEREKRLDRYYLPYHRAIARVIDAGVAAGVPPAVLAIHSFTESWKGAPRPWHVSVLWDRDPRLAGPLLELLYGENELIVGENQPYTGQYQGDTLWQHGTMRGLAHAIVEIRQDLIRDAAGQQRWAERVARLMRALLERPDLQLKFRKVGAGNGGLGVPTPTGQSRHRATSTEKLKMRTYDDKTRIELEAAAFRKLVAHLRQRSDVQNIDLMNLAGFCRNCLANWYQEAAGAAGQPLSKDEAREIVYGMPYKDWQAKHQSEATPEQKASFEKTKPHQH
jgi:predicted N-formylglutamate amidohydrolase